MLALGTITFVPSLLPGNQEISNLVMRHSSFPQALTLKMKTLLEWFFFRMMVEAKSGLIVNVSSAGGLSYLFNVPYGVGKAGVDRMSQDTAVELKKHNVAVLTLWPGPVRTELCTDLILGIDKSQSQSKYSS